MGFLSAFFLFTIAVILWDLNETVGECFKLMKEERGESPDEKGDSNEGQNKNTD